jgi:serine/threonine-protein kinase
VLNPGTRVGAYEILSLLGTGGMGAVFRARDTRLGRDIALKVLSEEFAGDSSRLARLVREARTLAALNHPNIAQLHGLEEGAGTTALVIELVEGESLSRRIARGPLPLSEALPLALQIAEALEAAHENGIIHRDLKPANVVVRPDGVVKVLDFGLAKAAERAAPDAATIDNSAITQPGAIVGTVAYMAPEQAKGQGVDRRADVWSFGCVLYEMLAGRRCFNADTAADTLVSVLTEEPDWRALPPLSVRMHEVLRRCLERNLKQRWQAIGDVRIELAAAIGDPTTVIAEASGPKKWVGFAAAALIAALIASAITVVFLRSPDVPRETIRFSHSLPPGQGFTRTGRHLLAASPDGSMIVYVANQQLYLRRVAEVEATGISGTELDASTPVFSPDSQWVAFYAGVDGTFKKVQIEGGTPVTLGKVGLPFGASWTGETLLAGQGADGIVRVPTGPGSTPTQIVKVNPGERVETPQLLPNGDVLFTLANTTGRDSWDKARIVVQQPSGERTELGQGADARYLGTGHIVYASSGRLFAVAFDLAARKLIGAAKPVLTGVLRTAQDGPASVGAAQFTVADSGLLAFVPGEERTSRTRQMATFRRNQDPELLKLPAAYYNAPRYAPSGRRIAYSEGRLPQSDIWVVDVDGTRQPQRLTFAGMARSPLWSPDGQRIAFYLESDDPSIAMVDAVTGGAPRLLAKVDRDATFEPDAWSKDGRTLLLTRFASPTRPCEIWSLAVDNGRLAPVVVHDNGKCARHPALSPDGRWLAYESDITGRDEIFVEPFPTTGVRYQVTQGGGGDPRWSADGTALAFFRNPTGRVDAGAIFVSTVRMSPFVVGRTERISVLGISSAFDVDAAFETVVATTADTDRSQAAPGFHVVVNWFEQLQLLTR